MVKYCTVRIETNNKKIYITYFNHQIAAEKNNFNHSVKNYVLFKFMFEKMLRESFFVEIVTNFEIFSTDIQIGHHICILR